MGANEVAGGDLISAGLKISLYLRRDVVVTDVVIRSGICLISTRAREVRYAIATRFGR